MTKIAWAIIFQQYGAKAVAEYTLLGKPDEISEEDARELVQKISFGFKNYKVKDIEFFYTPKNPYSPIWSRKFIG